MADKALLVGINNYRNAPLYGCLNDVSDMANFLVDHRKFKPENIKLLCDERATTEGILNHLLWLVDIGPKDRCFFHFSGHGAQIPTTDYRHELDGLDEVLCPIDFDWTAQHVITDKRLADIFERIPEGAVFTWVSDSCHSGDLTRDDKVKKIPRKFPMPPDVAWRVRGACNKKVKIRDRAACIHAMLDVGFVSGCKSNQVSADTEILGRPNGALTFFLLKALRKLDPGVSLKKLVKYASGLLKEARYSQCPQAEGSQVNRPFLGSI